MLPDGGSNEGCIGGRGSTIVMMEAPGNDSGEVTLVTMVEVKDNLSFKY